MDAFGVAVVGSAAAVASVVAAIAFGVIPLVRGRRTAGSVDEQSAILPAAERSGIPAPEERKNLLSRGESLPVG